MRTVQAMVHSKHALDTVAILHEDGPNNIVAEYNGKLYTAIWNVFNGLYYVDDIYGEFTDVTV
ncbi:MAG: hypothetical protein LBI19_04825 [Oscillospiraceae bacterium]|jgi:hypothetical protein|nr:hypothetical protein [Oscillospiraceae bacterium]